MTIDATHFAVVVSDFGTQVELQARIYTISGSTITAGSTIAISDPATTTDDNGNGHVVAALPNGNFIVAWAQFTNNFANAQMTVRTFDANFNPLSAETRVGQLTNTGTSQPFITVDGSNVAVAWSQNEAPGGDGSTHALGYAFTVNANGTLPALTLHDVDISDNAAPRALTHLANGDILAVFNGGPIQGGTLDDNDRLFGKVYSAGFASVVKNAFQINQNEQDTGTSLSTVIALPGGGFEVIWGQDPINTIDGAQTDFELFSRTYDGTYTATGNQTVLTANTTNDLSPYTLADSAGNVTLLWEDNGTYRGVSGAYLPHINEQPAGANKTVATNEDTAYTFTAADFGFTDTDGNALLAVKATTVPAAGTLTNNNVAVSAGAFIPVAAITGGLLKFTPASNGNGAPYSTFTFQVQDDGGTVGGGVDLDQSANTITVNVTAVNDPTVAHNDAFNTTENTAVNGVANVFSNNGSGSDSDVESDPFSVTAVNGVGASVGVQITLASGAHLTLGANGALTYDPNGAFNYLPGPASGASNLTATDSFSYTVTGGSTATVTVTITGVDSSGDVLRGQPGVNDPLDGGPGTDWYFVNDPGDTIHEPTGQGGTDRVFSRGDYTLPAGAEIEIFCTDDHAGTNPIALTGNELDNLIYGNAGDNTLNGLGGADTLVGSGGNDTLNGGQQDDILVGGTGNDHLNGQEGNDRLYGGTGNDTLNGGTGDDWYFVDDPGAVIVEAAGEGTLDRVFASVSYALSAGAAIEKFSTNSHAGVGAIDLTGNELANLIYGNAGSNVLNGGLGNDNLVGLGGADVFLFNTALDAATNVDLISDFNVADDTIRLENAIFTALATTGPLAAGAFQIGAAAAEGDDRIIYDSATGAVLYDPDGVNGVAATQFATLAAGLVLTEANFVVV